MATSFFGPPRAIALLASLGLLLGGCLYGPIGVDGQDEDLFGPPGGEQDDDTDDQGQPELVNPDNAVRGYVQDPLGLRLPGVQVVYGGETQDTTDGQGRFELPEVLAGEPVVLTFFKEGYATTWGTFEPTEHGYNYYSKTMAKVDLQMEFDSWQDTDFEIDGSHAFNLPADSVVDEDGFVYDGVVSLSATVWTIGKSLDEGGEFMAAPGDGEGVDSQGETQVLYTYGMFQLEMVGEQGEGLQAGQGVTVQVEVPADSGVQGGDQVPFWSFDDVQGEWIEQAQGTIVDLQGGGQVWEFQPTQGLPVRTTTIDLVTVVTQASCNPDDVVSRVQVTQTATATGQVTDAQGQAIQGAQVRIIAGDQTYAIPTQTDADGYFSANVPPVVQNPVGPNGRPLLIEVDYEAAEQPFMWRQDPIPAPPPGGVADFGQVDVGSMACVQGTVRDVSGQPVEGVQIAAANGGNAVSAADGSFCMQAPKWQPSSVYALPAPGDANGYRPARIRPKEGGGANCSSCPNVVDLVAYAGTSCAEGELVIDGQPADGVRIEAFDALFPTAPVFSAVVEDGAYALAIPSGTNVVLRVGAGDLHGDNECAAMPIAAQPSGDACVQVPVMECGG